MVPCQLLTQITDRSAVAAAGVCPYLAQHCCRSSADAPSLLLLLLLLLRPLVHHYLLLQLLQQQLECTIHLSAAC
jgi:hypothetical protein